MYLHSRKKPQTAFVMLVFLSGGVHAQRAENVMDIVQEVSAVQRSPENPRQSLESPESGCGKKQSEPLAAELHLIFSALSEVVERESIIKHLNQRSVGGILGRLKMSGLSS